MYSGVYVLVTVTVICALWSDSHACQKSSVVVCVIHHINESHVESRNSIIISYPIKYTRRTYAAVYAGAQAMALQLLSRKAQGQGPGHFALASSG